VSYDVVQYLYNHVRCCQLRALLDFFPHVSTFWCQFRDLVTDATHARVLYSSACATHPACYLGTGIMPIQAQSPHLFMELSDCHTRVVRRLITSIGCRPWSRKWLCFRKWTDCHYIFCRWLSFITVFAVPSWSPRWMQQSTEARQWFFWTLRVHLFSNENSSCLGSYGYFKLAFFGFQYSGCFHLQYSHLQRTLVHEGASWL